MNIKSIHVRNSSSDQGEFGGFKHGVLCISVASFISFPSLLFLLLSLSLTRTIFFTSALEKLSLQWIFLLPSIENLHYFKLSMRLKA